MKHPITWDFILNYADCKVSNKKDNDFLDIYEDLTNQSTDIESLDKNLVDKSLDNNLAENNLVDNNSLEVSDNESLNKNIIIDDDTQITNSLVNTNEIQNQTDIKDLHLNEPKGASNDTTLLNNVSEFDNVHYDISNNEHKLNNKKLSEFKTNELKNSEDELLNGLLKDKLIKIFEEHKLIIISIIIFLLIIIIVKRISQKNN